MKFRALLYVAIFIGIAFLSIPKTYLILKTDTATEIIEPVDNKDSFSIQWRHSVEKELWEEFFTIKVDQIYIEETRFKTFGAGVPSHAGSDSYIKDGWVYMVGIDRKIGEELQIRTGNTTAHQLNINGAVTLMEKPGIAYTVSIESMPIIQAWYQSIMKY
jgi:hypothetical protein